MLGMSLSPCLCPAVAPLVPCLGLLGRCFAFPMPELCDQRVTFTLRELRDVIVVPGKADASSLPALLRASLSGDGLARDPETGWGRRLPRQDRGATVDQVPQDHPIVCPRPELTATLVLKRADGGEVAKQRDRHFDGGQPSPGYLAGGRHTLTDIRLWAVAARYSYVSWRVTVVDAGDAQSAELGDPIGTR